MDRVTVPYCCPQEIIQLDDSEFNENEGIKFFRNMTLAMQELAFGEGNMMVVIQNTSPRNPPKLCVDFSCQKKLM